MISDLLSQVYLDQDTFFKLASTKVQSYLKMLRILTRTITAATLLLLSKYVICTSTPSVIIVGAGSSGIAAAAKLLENNITDITILEAEERIGGRIHSVKFGDAIIDLGAQWCHGAKDNIVYELVKNYDLLEPGEMTLTAYHSSHKYIDANLTNELYNLFYGIYTDRKQAREGSLGEYMIKRYNESIWKYYGGDRQKLIFATELLDLFMRATLSLEGAFSWFDVSAVSDFKDCEVNCGLNWKGRGYKTILDVLMKKYPNPREQLSVEEKIILNKEVIRVVWDNKNEIFEAPLVECSDGSTYHADHVIFTPALGVLKHGYLNLFDPLLPTEKIFAIEEIGIAAIANIFLHFPIKWWPSSHFTDFSFAWSENDKQELLQEFPYGPNKNGISWLTNILGVYAVSGNPNVLVAWFCGEFVPDIEQSSDDIITNGVMFVLNKFLNTHFDNITKPDSVIRHNWYSNRHFRGTFSYQTVMSRKREVSGEIVLSQPLTASNGKQTLLFAGEATHPTNFSTVHGAIETGFREAQRIIDLYK